MLKKKNKLESLGRYANRLKEAITALEFFSLVMNCGFTQFPPLITVERKRYIDVGYNVSNKVMFLLVPDIIFCKKNSEIGGVFTILFNNQL